MKQIKREKLTAKVISISNKIQLKNEYFFKKSLINDKPYSKTEIILILKNKTYTMLLI